MGSDAVFSALADDGGLDLWVLALKVMATGITATLSLLFLVFLASLRKPGRRERRAAWHFSLASLFATLYIAADTAVRAYAVLDAVDDVLLPYRLALSALILSIAAYVALAWSLGPASRRQSTMIGLLYAGAMLAAAVVWIEHPALVIAGPTVAVRGTGVYAHYGLAAGAFFALCVVLFTVMWRRLLPLAHIGLLIVYYNKK